ncbi:MAG: ATP-dependent helicase [Sarcina sp.]
MFNKLDEFQRQAVEDSGNNTLIVAPPGSGKTTVIIHKIKRLLDNGVDGRNIVVLTFTKAAAENMKERFKKVAPNNSSPFFGTFHGLFYKILLRYYGEIKLISGGESFGIIKKQLKAITEDVSDEKIKEVLNNISAKKSTLRTKEAFQSTLDEKIFNDCYEAYESYKEYKLLWDFDDLQIKTLELLESNEKLLNSYKGLFKYLLVDEFQDCDDIQIEFLQFINSNLFAVGDEDQCIYSFRGSNPDVMVRFKDYFENGKKIYLKYNYRSVKNIVSVSKDIIDKNLKRNEKEINHSKEKEGTIEFKIPFDESEQSKLISETIKKYKDENFKFSDNAILYRTNMESRSVIDAFIRNKIPFKLLDREFNFFKHFICEDLIAYLKLSIDPYNRETFTRIINKPYRYISKIALNKFNGAIEKINVFDLLLRVGEIHPFQVKKIEDLKDDIENLNKMTLGTAIDFILSDLGYVDYLKEYSTKYNQSIDELMEIVEEFKISAKEFNKIVPFLTHIKEVEENIEEAKTITIDAVILSTIHGVKGMEFKNVYMINVVKDVIPHKNADNIEEERRLFYVGATRAIENLYIYSPKTLKGSFKETSEFIPREFLDKVVSYESNFKIGQKVLSKSFGEGTVEEIKPETISVLFGYTLKMFKTKIVVENNLLEIL